MKNKQGAQKTLQHSKPYVLFFPGKGMHLKHYRSYFPMFVLIDTTSILQPTYIFCHSRGIDAALEYKSELPIIAIDPTTFPTDSRVLSWTKPSRKKEVPKDARVHYYTIETHYPYQIKSIRDKIANTLS